MNITYRKKFHKLTNDFLKIRWYHEVGGDIVGFSKEDKKLMIEIEKIIELYQGGEVYTEVNAFGNVIISSMPYGLGTMYLYLRKFQNEIILSVINLVKYNTGTAIKIIQELIKIVQETEELDTIVIENAFNPALKHIAIDKFGFKEHVFLKETYILKID